MVLGNHEGFNWECSVEGFGEDKTEGKAGYEVVAAIQAGEKA